MPFYKRAIDIAFSLAAMPFLALGVVLMAVIHKLGAPGPVFFRQERVGRGGRPFTLYKFRTMATGADTSLHQAYLRRLIGSSVPMVKMDSQGDSRLIPGAWLIRATGFDELPQVINVLRGEMSLVGPRPCLPYEYAAYLPRQRQRLDATPGLTGLWQISGKNRTTFDEMVGLDIRYALTQSFWLDAKIILLTAPAILGQIRDTRRARQSVATPAASPAPAEAPKGNSHPQIELIS